MALGVVVTAVGAEEDAAVRRDRWGGGFIIKNAASAEAISCRIDTCTRSSAAAAEVISVRVGRSVEWEHASVARRGAVVAAIMEIAPIQERARERSRCIGAPKRGCPFQRQIGIDRQDKSVPGPFDEGQMGAGDAVDGSIGCDRGRDVEAYALQTADHVRWNGGWAGRKWQVGRAESTGAEVAWTWRGRIKTRVTEDADRISWRDLHQPGIKGVVVIKLAVIVDLQHVVVDVP